MALEFNLNEIAFESEEYSFLKIGSEAKKQELSVYDFKNSKYKKIDKIWGTLGWANDKFLAVNGTIKFSENGNFSHKGVTHETAELLKEQNVEIHDHSDIRERFIDLSEIEFLNVPDLIIDENEIQLRFDLFIDKDEGALVYLEENPKGVRHSKYAEMYLITPESTDKDYSQERYSLSYRFTYSFNKKFVRDGKAIRLIAKEDTENTQFALKILTFPRHEADLGRYAQKVTKNLNSSGGIVSDLVNTTSNKIGEKKYALYKFQTIGEHQHFVQVDDVNQIDEHKKTLLLIHGTFSSVDKTFGELLEIDKTDPIHGNLFKMLLESKTFGQIIAFNHPTASHSIQENVDWLLALLRDKIFTQPVDIITTSRGALVAEKLCAYDIGYRQIKINKLLTFAPAHGSDLLNVAKGLDRMLSMMKKTSSKAGWGYILAISQFSINAIRKQPGLEVMMPDSSELKKILMANPINEIKIKAMVGDYDKSLIDKNFKRWVNNGLDKLLWLAFKSEHDWVIGCPEQRRQMSGFNASYEKNYEYFCIHGKQFDLKHPKKDNRKALVRKEIFNFFTEEN